MTEQIVTIILIVLATHRITRFLVADTLIAEPRMKLQMFFEQRWENHRNETRSDTWASRFAYLIGCSWCTSVYVAAAVTAGTAVFTSVPLPVLTALTASSVTGLLDELSHDG